MAQNQVLSKILDNQQKMVEVVTHTFSSSNSFIKDLKKKIKTVEQELATIASTVKDLSVSFPLIRHNFVVEMDMSSFPKMLQFKRKMLQHPQLLR